MSCDQSEFEKSCTKSELPYGGGMLVVCENVSTEEIQQILSDISDTVNITLHVKNCSLQKLPRKVIENKKINQLMITNCQLKGLDQTDLAGLEDLLEYLHLEENLLIDFPNLQGFKKIKTLILKNTLIEKIPNNVLNNFPNLEELSLDFNKITEIVAENFPDLPHLTKLSVQGNLLSECEIPELFFNRFINVSDVNISNTGINSLYLPNEMAALHFLYLSDNKIRTLKKSMFKTQPALYKLFLSRNKITEIDDDALEGLTQMNEISLEYNQMELLHCQTIFQFCTKLCMIGLNNNCITRVTADLFKNLNALSDLNLSHNEIEYIEEGCFPYEYPEFWFLNLSHNKLTKIEEKLFEKLSTLFLLDLTDNLINEIHNLAFKNLTELKFLVLKSNKLEHLPQNLFHGLEMVEILNLSDNIITNLEDSAFSGLTNLSHCYLSNNFLTSLPTNLFMKSLNLQEIYINNNNFTEVPMALQNLQNLRIVDLSCNPLSQLNNNSFKHLVSVYGLYISNCGIKAFPDDVFNDFINLKILDASFNQIDKIKESVLKPFLSSVLYIDLQGNPLLHDASSEWLFSLLKKLLSENPPKPDTIVLDYELLFDEITEINRDYVITYSNVQPSIYVQFVLKKPGELS